MDCMAKIVNLPKIFDKRGNLSFIEGRNHLPFEIRRTYWIYDVPGGEVRGGHAYRENEEFVVALSGSFDVVLHRTAAAIQSQSFVLRPLHSENDLAHARELFDQCIGSRSLVDSLRSGRLHPDIR